MTKTYPWDLAEEIEGHPIIWTMTCAPDGEKRVYKALVKIDEHWHRITVYVPEPEIPARTRDEWSALNRRAEEQIAQRLRDGPPPQFGGIEEENLIHVVVADCSRNYQGYDQNGKFHLIQNG